MEPLGERQAACTLCEAMCGLRISVDGDRVAEIRGDPDDPLSRGHICPKAVALRDVQDDPDRLRHPVRRTADGWQRVSWREALELTAEGLAGARLRHGADAVATYLGNPGVHSLGTMTHGPPLVRMLGSRNRFSASSLDQLPHQVVSRGLYGDQWLLPVPDVDRVRHLLVIGANPAVSNGSLMSAPGITRRLRELRGRGGRLVVLDPRRTETARLADEHHFVRPGTDAALLLAMVRTILDEDLAAPADYVTGLDRVRAAVDPFTPERAAAATGVAADTVRRLARDFAASPAAAAYGRTGVSTQRHGTACHWAIQLLNIVTGNLDRPGGTLLARPAVDPIGRLNPGRSGRWRSRVRGLPEFGGELPAAALAEEIAAPGPDRVRALLTVAGNPVLSAPGGDRLDTALAGLDFMAAVDFYVNETTRHAHVILPPTPPLERDHYDLALHLLAVRNTARFTPAPLPRPDGARHDWEVFRDLARAYRRRVRGAGSWSDRLTLAASPRLIVDLGLRSGPYRLSLRRVAARRSGVDLGPLTPSLPGRLATSDHRVHAAPDALVAAATDAAAALLDRPSGPELLLIGRRHLRSNNSWMHNHPTLTKGGRRDHLLMHPDDLAVRGIADGERVRLRSAAGEVLVPVRASAEIMPGAVSLPHGFGHGRPGVRLGVAAAVPGASANDVTDPAVLDPASGTAVFNGVPVTVERCP
ncbi:molybdopterin-dependent oxidoreductase [Allonocardiopsis opalescens]|uniref:Anaerobic selenocysteine-containing dehydrogenase n=1 Tax=Allonocardiopsis opalescens TaxID=1144618 RepID=A0A2T0Q4S0_9ACTN|nr:molybdopterin-dependent oxidoreductase [Allonocardiopsis opalescens]PRX98815.1 anaerobic selenocysteine-containing dehydrogenase [Allonocardiopsis opalescens]